MRYELADHEWAAIKPFLPNKPRGIPRVNDRRVLNGIFGVLRSGAPWRDLPDNLARTPPATFASCAGDGRASGITSSRHRSQIAWRHRAQGPQQRSPTHRLQ